MSQVVMAQIVMAQVFLGANVGTAQATMAHVLTTQGSDGPRSYGSSSHGPISYSSSKIVDGTDQLCWHRIVADTRHHMHAHMLMCTAGFEV